MDSCALRACSAGIDVRCVSMMYLMRLQHTLSALLGVKTGLELTSDGLKIGSHGCEGEEGVMGVGGGISVLRECLNGSKHFSRKTRR